MLLGGFSGQRSEEMLLSFWQCYKVEHPDHAVFQFNDDRLRKTIPITIHGDGGRTQKHQPLEIFSMQPVIGLDTQASHRSGSCHCPTSLRFGGADPKDPATHRLNSKHSTFLTHFLIFAYPSKNYSDFPGLLTEFLELVCSNLGVLCNEGALGFDGSAWYPCCVGFKLDMEWMAKCGSLTRSYQNVGHVKEKACCTECEAGLPHFSFENVNADAPWTLTRWRTIPWTRPPPWRGIPFDSGKPAKFLRRDAFHIFRMGIGRIFLASCVYLLICMNCPLYCQGHRFVLMFFKFPSTYPYPCSQ